ncbi:beta-mannosidase [candidate division FCPU426 bacterium]|nr:beta-mannosidase [candidate division FCPU426 bacterium]
MPMTLDLNHDWQVRASDLGSSQDQEQTLCEQADGWLPCSLPCDVHMPLLAAGQIPEPLEADHVLALEWIEEKAWWFRKSFTLTEEHLAYRDIVLELDGLDVEADCFVNHVHVGHHRSAFYPLRQEIKSHVRLGANMLMVRLTAGPERYGHDLPEGLKQYASVEEHSLEGRRGDRRRIFLRKPQYVFGWDWAPRLASCGITGSAKIHFYNHLVFPSLQVCTLKIETSAFLSFSLEIENLSPFITQEAAILVQVFDQEQCVLQIEKITCLQAGVNFIELEANLAHPKLWWPNGIGAPYLYTCKAMVQSDRETAVYPAFQFGVRTIRLDQSQINVLERLFAIVVNGRRIFCKGANWVPADSIYARVKPEKYTLLVREAVEANFNMFRVWGGGCYEQEQFYRLCDEHGMLIWQDFMFSCALYPDQEEWFVGEIRRELEYQTKRLRNHACLALWCGNNENHWIYYHRLQNNAQLFHGKTIYNRLAPEIIRKNCPQIPYWNSSPFGGAEPNANEIGDQHHWHEGMMNPDMQKRITPEAFNHLKAKFVSEFGYIGPCVKSSIQKYYGRHAIRPNDNIWRLHTNTFEKNTVAAGIRRHYRDPETITLDEYLLYAGLCQGLMYGYALEALRFLPHCSGALFWMYNDTWGETGWSVLDYYAARKIAYYFVKRAFVPVQLVLRATNNRVSVLGINETPSFYHLDLEYGSIAYSGQERQTQWTTVNLKPLSRRLLFSFPLPDKDPRRFCCFVLPNQDLPPALLRQTEWRNLQLVKPALEISEFAVEGGTIRFVIKTDVYAHAVHFNLGTEIKPSDEYFDLLPGASKRITCTSASAAALPENIIPASVYSF